MLVIDGHFAALKLQGMTVRSGDVQPVERRQGNMFQHPVNRDVDRMLGRSIGGRNTAINRRLNVKIIAAKSRIDLKKQALPFGFVAVPGRVILAEFFGRQIRSNQRFGNQGKIKMNRHGQ